MSEASWMGWTIETTKGSQKLWGPKAAWGAKLLRGGMPMNSVAGYSTPQEANRAVVNDIAVQLETLLGRANDAAKGEAR